MQIHYIGRHFEITDALKNYTVEKLSKIESRLKNITRVNVTMEIDNLRHIAEATIHVAKTEIHAKAEAVDMYAAIDELADKLLTQVTKLKDKLTDHHS